MFTPITGVYPPVGVTLDDRVAAEISQLRADGDLDYDYNHARCHVCCESEAKDLVNKLLAAGLTNREISEACGGINARRQQRGDERMIGPRNVWNHRRLHFNIDRPVQAAYRTIFERRAQEANR